MGLKTAIGQAVEFQETSGSTAADSHSFGNDYALTSVTLGASGPSGTLKAGTFNGSTSKALLLQKDGKNVQCTRNFMMSIWVKPDAVAVGAQEFFLSSHASNSGAGQYQFGIDVADDSFNFRFSDFDVSGKQENFNYTPAETVRNVWNHLVAWIDFDADEVRFYRNGVESANSPVSGVIPRFEASALDITIGTNAGGTNRPYKGDIFQVAIWYRAGVLADVAELYNNGNGLLFANWSAATAPGFALPSTTVAYYKCNDTVSPLTDAYVNKFDLPLISGTPTFGSTGLFGTAIEAVAAAFKYAITKSASNGKFHMDDVGKKFTIMGWIKMAVSDTNANVVQISDQYTMAIGDSPSKYVAKITTDDSVEHVHNFSASNTNNPGQFQMLVITYDGAGDFRAYIDGKERGGSLQTPPATFVSNKLKPQDSNSLEFGPGGLVTRSHEEWVFLEDFIANANEINTIYNGGLGLELILTGGPGFLATGLTSGPIVATGKL